MAWEPDYVTTEEFKSFARISDDLDNAHIARAISAASRSIDKSVSCRPNGLGHFRQFGKDATAVARYYTARWDIKQAKWVVEIDDLMDITALLVEIDTTDDGVHESVCMDYILRPRDALANNLPYTQLTISHSSSVQPTCFPDSVKITGTFGWNTVPEPVKMACLLQAHRFFKRRLSPLGVTGSSQTGSGSKEKAVVYELDPDIYQSVAPKYTRLGRTA